MAVAIGPTSSVAVVACLLASVGFQGWRRVPESVPSFATSEDAEVKQPQDVARSSLRLPDGRLWTPLGAAFFRETGQQCPSHAEVKQRLPQHLPTPGFTQANRLSQSFVEHLSGCGNWSMPAHRWAFALGLAASSLPVGTDSPTARAARGSVRQCVWQSRRICRSANPVEERNGLDLEVLLSEDKCPFLAAFFSASSPLAQTEKLAQTEHRVASAFPELRYVRVDADQLGIRAFLQWDIAFLPTYVLILPGREVKERQWIRWKGDGANPYDYSAVAAFVSRATGLIPANTSFCVGPSCGHVTPRGSATWNKTILVASWIAVAIVAMQFCRVSG